ncbi:EfeM/EfeO family lipoprotein [Actinacidiphila bryophytorum]|uniref:EfeM/EfeO family lipoprotein n=1 Tax=Actinacidiphila bryophytorum TaxID=1436133 RepID=UPI002176B8B1|nr:EfeM/EfeO family lipoprotein [Actinacidiphila bryophytorum]UWE09572.1 EfeM/EfeO family lipoprotein [Actinacidiphila bryophytorum]
MSAEPDGIVPPHPPEPARPNRFRRWQAAAAVVVVAAAVTATVLAAGAGGKSSSPDAKPTAPAGGLRHTVIEVSTGTCGRGWTRPQAGTQVFDLHNTSSTASEVDLTDPRTGLVYGEVEGLAPGTTRAMTVDLGSGSYAFKCLENDADAVTGPTVVVAGKQPQGPAAAPVNQHDLIPPTLAYQKWVGQRIDELAAGTGKLKADIDGGDLAAARRDWLPAHLVYERMGAAYDTFGDADAAINGTVARTPGATADKDFAGFHRIEYGLWHGESAASLRAPAAALDGAVRSLQKEWPQARMDPAAMGLRAHEIVENAEQFELTARTDYGSGTNLATARANLDGTRAILAQLRGLLEPRDTGLPKLDAALDRTQAALDAQHHGAAWTPVDKLTHAQRQQINADFGDLLEQLAPVAAIFEVRRTA